MESLKIAIASDWFYPPKIGGIESHIDELSRNLLLRGHEPPHVLTHDYRYMKPYVDDSPYPPVHRFAGTFYFRSYHSSVGFSQLWRINELYKEMNFDITHVHSIYSPPFSVAVSDVSRGLRNVPPVVATNHSFYGKPPPLIL